MASGRAPWFTFLIHPRGFDDLLRWGPGPFLRKNSANDDEFVRKACSSPPVAVGEIRFGFSPGWGELVSVMRMPEDLLAARARQDVLDAAQVAIQRGARVIGLGALTAPATGGGLTLVSHMPRGVTVTNGNAFTAAVVRDNVIEASHALGLGTDTRVAVVGCTGSVGAAASHLLAESGFRLVLVGRNEARVRSLLHDLQGEARFSGTLADVKDANVIVLLTSDSTAVLRPEHVQPGAVVIDCAQPANVPHSDHARFLEHGVVVVEGGLVRIPNYTCTFKFGMESPLDTFACLAETYMFAREGITEHSVGRPPAEMSRKLDRIAARLGIRPRPLRLAELLAGQNVQTAAPSGA